MSDRRDFLLGLSALTASAEAATESLYIPERHVERDRELLHAYVEEYSFAMVISANGGIRVTNVPTLVERAGEGWGKVWWHLAKSNPQNGALTGEAEAVVVFHGPHGYISPSWYAARPTVPTWNFAVVHLHGKPRRVDDDAAFARSLDLLVASNEKKYGGAKKWELGAMHPEYLKGMRQQIVAYEMTIEKVEAKFKLGQERTAADRAGVLQGLERPQGRSLYELTRDYYARLQG
jgi:transcriptional regulator